MRVACSTARQSRGQQTMLYCVNRHSTAKDAAHYVWLVHPTGGSPGIQPGFHDAHYTMRGEGGEDAGNSTLVNLAYLKHTANPRANKGEEGRRVNNR